jgi:primosomal protein N' (replication factor Y)
MDLFAKVVLDQNLEKPLDYLVPAHLRDILKPGHRVLVPLKEKSKKGTILSIENFSSFPNVKPISEVLSEQNLLTKDLLDLADWISKYYATSLSKVIQSILPSSVRKDTKEKKQLLIERAVSTPKLIEITDEIRLKNPKQALVLDVVLKNPKGIFLSELLEIDNISPSSIDTLIKKGILDKSEVLVDRTPLFDDEYIVSKPKTLTNEQAKAFESIKESLDKNIFQTHLLHGITGSGKTEVYLQAIDHTLKLGKGVILLVPEIALTKQTIERLKSRFQRKIAVIHYRLSDGEKFDTWHNIRKGEIQIVIGARSSVFSPLPNLGLIIVDEEHESSYKQFEDSPCYHARDIAIVRGKLNLATVILGSATPSLESYTNAKNGKYLYHELKHRPNGQRPKVHIVNMKEECDRSKGFKLLSDLLIEKMKKNLDQGEQTILFLNKRGYFSCQICKECKSSIKCKHCDMSLTFHRGLNVLSCHICGFHLKPPIEVCPSCHKSDTLKYQGPGTEQVERSLHAIFPGIRTLRMDRDTTKHKGSHDRIFNEFRTGKADVLIGTQMIAKGLHFPAVTLVGVLGADTGLYIPDFRSNENVFQLITQVAGRAGRGELPGEVVLQSFLFDHPIIKLAAEDDYQSFAESEIIERKEFHYPPFVRLVKFQFSGKDVNHVLSFANMYHKLLKKTLPVGFEILSLNPSLRAKVKDKFRFQFLLKGEKITQLSNILKSISLKKPNDVSLLIDVDPTSTFS